MDIQETIQKIIDLCEDRGLMATIITKDKVYSTVLSTPDQEIARRVCAGKRLPDEWNFQGEMDHTEYFQKNIQPLTTKLHMHCVETKTALAAEVCFKIDGTTHACDLSFSNVQELTNYALNYLFTTSFSLHPNN